MTDKKHKPISDAEEARIQKMIASDPDAPEATDEQISEAKPFTEAFPALADKMRKNVGGAATICEPEGAGFDPTRSRSSHKAQGNRPWLAKPGERDAAARSPD